VYKLQQDNVSNAIQYSLKSIVNTSYGILSSSYFDINNVILSYYITSTIRVQIWLMSKPLNTYLSITDGGPFSLMNTTSFYKTNFKQILNKF
jgi:hypothetical protein